MEHNVSNTYGHTFDLWDRYNEIMEEIHNVIKPYSELYFSHYDRETYKLKDEKLFTEELFEILNKKSDIELGELNMLCRAFSQTNCGWYDYGVAQYIHAIIMKIWY